MDKSSMFLQGNGFLECWECEEQKDDVEECVNPYLYAKTLKEVKQNLCEKCYANLKEKS